MPFVVGNALHIHQADDSLRQTREDHKVSVGLLETAWKALPVGWLPTEEADPKRMDVQSRCFV